MFVQFSDVAILHVAHWILHSSQLCLQFTEVEPALIDTEDDTGGGGASHHLKYFRYLFTDECIHIPRKREDDDDQVVHSAADREGLGVIVQTVTSREVYYVYLVCDPVHHWYVSVGEESGGSHQTPESVE